jgi:DNA processing protein
MENLEELRTWLRIYLTPNLGPITFAGLLERWGSPEKILKAPIDELEKVCRRKISAQALIKGDPEVERQVTEEINKIARHHVRVITCRDVDFPKNLLNIKSYPPVLYVRGNILPQDANAVAIVGTRTPSRKGMNLARSIAREVAGRGYTVVSGLARGIDSEVHCGALEAEGRTIAVLGCGLDIEYPPENRKLKERIIESGAVITEFPMGTRPERGNFPRRNRIISGLSLGAVVIEAGQRSGALITARYALEQNREVMAVPGEVRTHLAQGVNSLIKQGAELVESADDIIAALPLWAGEPLATPPVSKNKSNEQLKLFSEDPVFAHRATPPRPGNRQIMKTAPIELNPDEKMLMKNLGVDPIHVDGLLSETGLGIGPLSHVLLELELKGLIQQLPGKFYIKLN